MKLGEVNTQILTFVMLDVFMYHTLPQFLSNSFKIFQLLACIHKQSPICVDLDQLDSQKPADLVFTLFQNRIYQMVSMEKN